MLNRRHFSKSASGLLSLLTLSRVARAAGETYGQALTGSCGAIPEPHFFLYIQVYGAWDVCLAFDPKDRDAKLPNGSVAFDQPYAMADVKQYANGIVMAPAGAPLGRWCDRLSIINGIEMDIDNGHVVDNMMAGFMSPRAANLPWVQCLVAKLQPYLKTCTVPHLYTSYDGQFFVGGLGDTSITATGSDFAAVLAPAINADNSSLGDVHAMVGEYQSTQASAARRLALGTYTDAIGRALQVGAALRAGGFSPPADATTPEGIASLLGQLYAEGVLGSATLSFGQRYFFDTHFDHYAAHPLGKALSDVDTICATLAKIRLDDHTSVLERTTIVMSGEFSRTPRLNAAAGKDHNIHSNSLLLLGHKVRPGVFGASGYRQDASGWSAHNALPLDLATGRPSASGSLLHASNLWAGLGSVAGADLTTAFGGSTKPVGFL